MIQFSIEKEKSKEMVTDVQIKSTDNTDYKNGERR